MVSAEIAELMTDLKEARENLENIRDEYKDNPNLLSFYEPSAQFIVRQYEIELCSLLSAETGSNLEIEEDQQSVDLWVRLEGEQFKDGRGPIGLVGSYLQKLNVANRHAVRVIKRKEQPFESSRLSPTASYFDLVATAAGSLKLGLKKPDLISVEVQEQTDSDQLELFAVDPWNNLKEIAKTNSEALEGFQLLVKTLSSTEDEKVITELKKDFDEKDVLKLIHYAKELAPSSRSSIDSISFEGLDLGIKNKSVIKTNKETRKLLTTKAKLLKQDTEYVEASGIIRALDLDNLTLVLRQLKIKNYKIREIESKLLHDITTDELQKYLDQVVSVSGFLIFNTNNQPIRLEIDEISIESDE